MFEIRKLPRYPRDPRAIPRQARRLDIMGSHCSQTKQVNFSRALPMNINNIIIFKTTCLDMDNLYQ